jgi:hypothetical protein
MGFDLVNRQESLAGRHIMHVNLPARHSGRGALACVWLAIVKPPSGTPRAGTGE